MLFNLYSVPHVMWNFFLSMNIVKEPLLMKHKPPHGKAAIDFTEISCVSTIMSRFITLCFYVCNRLSDNLTDMNYADNVALPAHSTNNWKSPSDAFDKTAPHTLHLSRQEMKVHNLGSGPVASSLMAGNLEVLAVEDFAYIWFHYSPYPAAVVLRAANEITPGQ